MLTINPEEQNERDNYKLLIGSILPRPIAFITTLSAEGVLNAAPFSYFNIVSADPPMISVSIQRKNGARKDTSRNIMETGSFVVHISDEDYIEAINQTAANLPPDESEVDLAQLTSIPSAKIKVPGIAEAKIRMECTLEQSLALGGTPSSPSCDLIIGRIVCFHIVEELYESGRIDAQRLKPVSRLAGNNYSKLGEIFSIDRPN
ncbi:flavin reductase family protein [Paenibacillus guangzhouensis]|uniref:flavin reductase family protein n=1 Tax=Paenibacillus guangzhouensis TaxID=1473112 RepID=UPI00126689A7|nr:flavin reductase family protein [Paenibacillus guangzhouensis]